MSNLLSHAKHELDLIGMIDNGDETDMNTMMRRHILMMMEVFSNEGHSGFSASYAANAISKLMMYKPLSPLTGEDDEWFKHDYGGEPTYHPDFEKIALENPKGVLSTFSSLMKCSQVIQPYEYGDDASKETWLWLKNLPNLKPTRYVEPRIVDGKPRWANQTDSGQNRLGPSADRWKIRSETYPGIARAMADQWGGLTT